jgi:polyhydroxyalkanoate synthesis regulator phasin
MKWGLGLLGLAAVGVIAIAAIGFGGSASAQTPPPDPTATTQTQNADAQHALEVFAQKLGVSVDQVTSAAKETRDQLVDEAVASGKITADQGAKIKSMDVGSFLKFRRHPLAARVGKALGNVFQDAADILHLSKDDLKTKLQSGQSLADIATAQNVDPADLQAQIKTSITSQVDQALSDGKISQDTHDRILQNLDQRLDKIINHKGGTGPGANFRGRFGPKGQNQTPSQSQ